MMLRLLGRVLAAVVLLAAVWGLGSVPDAVVPSWLHPVGAPRGPVRILRFYATKGKIGAGDKAQLCYGVENAKSVRISPIVANVLPVGHRCLEIAPDHTTHYIILAEGFDGSMDTKPLTLVVGAAPAPPKERANMAALPRQEGSPVAARREPVHLPTTPARGLLALAYNFRGMRPAS
jgi:hypothetical protein